MANNNIREEINKRRRELGEYERQAKNECNHKDSRGSFLIPLSEFDGFIKDRNKYDDYDMICTDCGEIVSFRTFTPSEISFAVGTIRSMANQLKVLGNLTETEYEQIVDGKPKLGYEFQLLDVSQRITPMNVLKVDGLQWYEIDDTQDLKFAEKNIKIE